MRFNLEIRDLLARNTQSAALPECMTETAAQHFGWQMFFQIAKFKMNR